MSLHAFSRWATWGSMAIMMIGTGIHAAAQEWQLVWADEFDVDGAPDESKWSFLTGKITPEDEQFYTDRTGENANAYVQNGMLIIEARKEDYEGSAYTSACLHTMTADHTGVKFSTAGGRLEVRAKLPDSAGSWPAFWTVGDAAWLEGKSWPRGGEIDVFEYVANSPNFVFGNLHYMDSSSNHKDHSGFYQSAPPIAGAFHTFRVDWYSDRMEWYFDDILYHAVTIDASQMTDDPFNAPHHLLLNYGLGGDWPGSPDAGFTSDQYLIDYVRVSHLIDVPEPGSSTLLSTGILLLLLRLRIRTKSLDMTAEIDVI